jgi:hypothetical protein
MRKAKMVEGSNRGSDDHTATGNSRFLGPLSLRSAILVLLFLLAASGAIGGVVAVTLLNRPTGEGLHLESLA